MDQWACMSAWMRHASDPSRYPSCKDNELEIARNRRGRDWFWKGAALRETKIGRLVKGKEGEGVPIPFQQDFSWIFVLWAMSCWRVFPCGKKGKRIAIMGFPSISRIAKVS